MHEARLLCAVRRHAVLALGARSLDAIHAEVVRQVQRIRQCRRATVDVDATLIEAHEQLALESYEGFAGHQPQMAWWAEQSMRIADQFRDGNVPAEFEARAFPRRAFAALPGSVVQRRLRADGALYNERALTWADDRGDEFAPKARLRASKRTPAPLGGHRPLPTDLGLFRGSRPRLAQEEGAEGGRRFGGSPVLLI